MKMNEAKIEFLIFFLNAQGGFQVRAKISEVIELLFS